MQDRIHQARPNQNITANVDSTNSVMTTNQSVETQNEANQRVNGKTCNAIEWSSVQNQNNMASNLVYNTQSANVSAASGQVAYLVPASGVLQYNNDPVPCSNVFIRLVQPININTSPAPCRSPFVVTTSSSSPAYSCMWINRPLRTCNPSKSWVFCRRLFLESMTELPSRVQIQYNVWIIWQAIWAKTKRHFPCLPPNSAKMMTLTLLKK